MSDQVMHNKEYIGRDGFYWWMGQIPEEGVWKENISGFPSEDNTESKGWGERYRVRIMGSHIDQWDGETGDPDIPDEELPWATVMYPVTAGGGGGGASASSNITQGTFVYGFYLDGEDGQQPVIMGCLGINDFAQVGAEQASTFTSFSGFAERNIPPYLTKEESGGEYAKIFDSKTTFNVATIWSESVNGSNTSFDYGSGEIWRDAKKQTQLPPSPDCKSPLTSMQLQLKNTIQEIEKARKSAYDFRQNLNKEVSQVEDWIDAKLQEGAKVVAGAIKWLFTEIEKFVIAQFNSIAKKFYNFLMPNEQPALKEGMEQGSDIIACLFKKLIAALFDIALDFLKGLVDNAVNTAECVVTNFLGGLLGQLADLINGALDSAFGLVGGIIDGIGGAIDGVLGAAGGALQMIVDVLSFLNCEEKPECDNVENWSIWDGANAGAGLGDDFSSLIENITNVAGGFSGAIDIDNFDFNMDFNDLFDSSGSCDTGARECGPPTASFFGSGVDAAVNLIVSPFGEILGGDVVNPGYGYLPGRTYSKVKDDCGIGQGGIIDVVFGDTFPPGGGGTPITDPSGNPSTGIVDIVVIQPGKDYLPAPNGSTGGDDRVWADPEDTTVINDDGTIRVPIPPDNPINVNPGDEVTTPPGTDTETDTGQKIPGGIPTIIDRSGTLVTPTVTYKAYENEYPSSGSGAYPVILYLCDVIIDNPGINYSEGDELVIEPNFGAKAVPKLGDFGKIVSIKVTEGGEGFTEMPKITVKSLTGFNAELIPKFCIDRSVGEDDLERDPGLQDKVISVIDCVGKFNVPN